jgi:hypothetical protein
MPLVLQSAVYDAATVVMDQSNGASASQQHIQFGTPPLAQADDGGNAPLPLWFYGILATLLLGIVGVKAS